MLRGWIFKPISPINDMYLNNIHLKDIYSNLQNYFVEIDHDFLKDIIFSASGSDFPWKNKEFIRKIKLSYNKASKRAIGLESLMGKNRKISFRLITRLKELSNVSWDKIEKNIISICAGKNSKGKVYIKFPLVLDKDFGMIVGHILGDGSIDKKYNQVFFTNKDKNLSLEFFKLMKSKFGIDGRIWLQKSGKFAEKSKWIKRINTPDEIPANSQIGLFYPTICGKILNIIFGDFAIGKEKKISNKILNFPSEFKIGLIRAFFDDEGHMDRERGPRFHQDREEMLEKIRIMLGEFNINSCPVRSYFREGKERYYFNVNHRDNYTKYYKLIGSGSEKKLKVLQNLVANAQ